MSGPTAATGAKEAKRPVTPVGAASAKKSAKKADKAKRAKDKKSKRRRGRSFRFTREGKVFVAVTLGVGIAAINTGNNLLYLVLGLLLSLLLVSGTLSDLALYKLRLKRGAPDRLFAGSASLFAIEMRNAKQRLPTYSVEVEDLAEDESKADRRCFFLKVGANSAQDTTYRRTPLKRGVLRMTQMIARTRYPFGLIEKGQRYSRPEELIVFPERIAAPLPQVRGLQSGEEATVSVAGTGTEVLGLRDYRQGDEARAIHWRRTANLDRLVVRETARDSRGRMALLIDRRQREDETWAKGFERAIGQAAFLAEWALAEGMGVEIVSQGSRSAVALPGSTPEPLWRYLALLEALPAESRADFPSMAPHVHRIHMASVESAEASDAV